MKTINVPHRRSEDPLPGFVKTARGWRIRRTHETEEEVEFDVFYHDCKAPSGCLHLTLPRAEYEKLLFGQRDLLVCPSSPHMCMCRDEELEHIRI